MSFFEQFDGKIFVEDGDPEPMRCPDCRRVFQLTLSMMKGGKVRCPGCQYDGNKTDFKGSFVEIGKCRILVTK